MRTLLLAVLMLSACATVSGSSYEESSSCPSAMTEEEHESGVVRCRAMCSSYARDFATYDADCKCRCAPPNIGGGYRPKPKARPNTAPQI